VLLLEKRQEIGSPVRCAEGVGHKQIIPFIDPDPLWVAAEVDRAEINLHREGEKRTYHAEGGHGYILERRVFDRVLAENAAQTGAEVRVKTAVSGLLMDAGKVAGVKVQRGDFITGEKNVEIEAQVVIAADGVEAQVGRWAGMDLQLPLQDTMVCVQYLLAGIDIDPRCTSYTIDYETAPGGYAWIFPKGEGKANIGLGVQADLWADGIAGVQTDQAGTGKETVLGYLTRFIENDPRLAQGYPVSLITGNVPVAPIEQLVTHGMMLVGDAARQVDPLTGGGIVNAMQAGKIAAQVAAEALTTGDTSIQSLGSYQDQWDRSTGRKLKRNNRLRGKFPPQSRTDERFVRFFTLAAAG
jgi:digeranylgeranylglycerophospholipid reductase